MPSTLNGVGSRWVLPNPDAEAVQALQGALGVPRVLASILVQRGYADPVAAERFLKPDLAHLHDPRTLPDYESAISVILGAKERKERIFVFGDYDVDGITSASLLQRFLSRLGFDVVAQVPERRQGYGIQESSVFAAKEVGAKVFLSCDCGSTAVKPVAMAREAGMAVVVTDHHELDEEMPDAHAVVNPHRADSQYPFKGLSGVGVVFKLCLGLARELGVPEHQYLRAFLDLAALGTVVDMMPLVDENRVITKFGLPQIEATKKVGLRALITEYSKTRRQQGPLKLYDLGFGIGPRLNAAGRVSDAANALRLLTTEDELEAAMLASAMEEANQTRRTAQERAIAEAAERIVEQGLDQRNAIVVLDPGWHGGVVGIVASKLVEMFRRPVFVGTVDPETGKAKASARSIPAFHLADAIHSMHPLVSGGGHAMAAGVSFDLACLEEFADRIHAYAGERLQPEDFLAQTRIDVVATRGELDVATVEGLAAMEPCGMGNPAPVFAVRGVRLTDVRLTKNENVVQLKFDDGSGRPVSGVTFSQAVDFLALSPNATLDVAFKPEVDTYYADNPRVKWTVSDFRVSNEQN